MSKALLFSGGMDSAALALWKRPEIAITIDYGQQSAEGEIRASKKISKELGLKHEIITVDCRSLGSGDLAGSPPILLAPVPEWWPFRNQLLITIAAMRAVQIGVAELLLGTVATDNVHADGGKEFFRVIDDLVALQEGNLRITTPAISMKSVHLIQISKISRSLLAWTHSCHTSSYACGHCRGCSKHLSILEELGYA